MTDKGFNPKDEMSMLDPQGRIKCGCGSIISTAYNQMGGVAYCPICSKDIFEWLNSLPKTKE